MEAVGIVVEYNPFHNGHKYHLKKARELGDVVIACMSGDFVQRGEPAFINKKERTKMCLREGVDIVVELPVFYSTQNAEVFAKGALMLLSELRIKKILFGSEDDNIEKLLKIIDIENEKKFKEYLKENLKKGESYPNAYNMGIKYFLGNDFEIKSNDILGIEYLRAIKILNEKNKDNEDNEEKIEACSLKREAGGYYSEESDTNILSATGIRKIIEGYQTENIKSKSEDEKKYSDKIEYCNGENIYEKIRKYIPEKSYNLLCEELKRQNTMKLSDFYNLIRYNILMNKNKLKDIQDVEDGFENRLYEMAVKYSDFKDFWSNLMTRRYTIGRVQRILLHILLDIKKEDTLKVKEKIPYLKILGFSEKGKEYLKELKKNKLKKFDKKINIEFEDENKIENESKIQDENKIEDENKVEILTTLKNIQKKLKDEELYFLEMNEKASIIYKMFSNYQEMKIPEMYMEDNKND